MRNGLKKWGLAFGALAAAVVLRWLLDPILGDTLPLVTLFAAVAVAVWVGGYHRALLVAVVGYIACNMLFMAPRGALVFGHTDFIGILAYATTCGIIIGLGSGMRTALRRSQMRGEMLRVTLASMGDAVITTDKTGSIASMNGVAEALTGWTSAEATGRPLDAVFRIVDEATRRNVGNPATEAVRESAVVDLKSHTLLIRKDGTEVSIEDSAAPIKEATGEVAGGVVVFRDVTERRRIEQENIDRLGAARMLASLVASSGDAIVSKSLTGIIQTWNASAERLFGHSAEQAIGHHISLIIPADRLTEEDQILGRIRAGVRVEHFETVRVRRDGSTIHVSLTVSPILDEEGNIVGASKIARDITDRKQAEERIYALLGELKDADRRKDEFLAMLAHELRNPLAPLRNILEVMKHASHDSGVVQSGRETMERQLNQLVRLVDDLLDVSRITRDKLELRTTRVELAPIIRQAMEASRPLADATKHEIDLTLPPEPIWLDADSVRLVQVFANLLNNACKFSEPGSRIALTAWQHDGKVAVTVTDHGVGIPNDKLDHVFDLFAQIDQTLERSRGGLGIGLTLVKRLVEMHGGAVEAKSDGIGKGSAFTVRLPVVDDGLARPHAGMAEPAVATRRFLVVDDNRDAALSLGMLLRITGHETYTAHDGEEAVAVAAKVRPDVILLDIGLPKLNGYDVCRRIREQPWGRDILMVALTGWGQEEDRKKSRDAGFDAHMVKPIDYTVLMALLAAETASRPAGGRTGA